MSKVMDRPSKEQRIAVGTQESWETVRDKMSTGNHSVSREIERMKKAKAAADAFKNNPAPEYFNLNRLLGRRFNFYISTNDATFYVAGQYHPEIGRGPVADMTIEIVNQQNNIPVIVDGQATMFCKYEDNWRFIGGKFVPANKSDIGMIIAMQETEPQEGTVKVGNGNAFDTKIRNVYNSILYFTFRGFRPPRPKMVVMADEVASRLELALEGEEITDPVEDDLGT